MADTDDATYAPQSPDLTAADQFEPHPQHREYRGSIPHISPFTPTSDLKSPFGFPPQLLTPSAHRSYPQPGQPQPQPQAQSPRQYPPLDSQQASQAHTLHSSPQPLSYYNQHFAPTSQSPSHPPPQPFNPYFANATAPQHAPYGAPIPAPHRQGHPPQHPHSSEVKLQESHSAHQDSSGAAMPAAVRGGKKAKKEEEDAGGAEYENNAPGVKEGIEVRTKFPVARIKRIMQADEDVGKVAQVTPVAVSKALELFMISLVTKAAAQARSRGSKRVLATHLKQAVLEDDQFDYLQEIVSKVVEAPSKTADKHEDSDDAMDGGSIAPAKKKRATGGGKKRRKNSDDDS
ncbi:uncharacterized protein PV09_06622 [Verruconis gallopava]|uniref:NCT transcriptional regulatory complex subunit A n=1 Tax=Verruconis gallopava TaxID=253628 RepID=A0A0D2ASI7_9PEZI|nr:uncharacterized protein PV09_06622 [Verruconis gallopava]KIW02134.1 hypothetical protein PV09_06622 [Verruconis gallopava]